MAVKLFVSDIDGTLVISGKNVSEKNVAAVKKMVDAGIIVTIATGRMYRTSLHVAEELQVNVPIITYNGALIKSVSGEIFHEQCLSPEIVVELANFFEENNLYVQSFSEDKLRFPFRCEHSNTYESLMKISGEAVGWDGLRKFTSHVYKFLSISDTAEEADKVIAMLGTADAVTSVLVKTLKDQIPELLSDDKLFDPLVDVLATKITDEAWNCVEAACEYWIKYGKTTDRDELKRDIEYRLTKFKNNSVSSIINSTLQSFIKDESESVRKEMNKIISRYAPGREITISGNVSLGNQQAIAESLNEMNGVIQTISKSMGDIIADALWVALGVILWGVFAAPYYILKALLTSDESKRKDKAKDILGKKDSIKCDLIISIYKNLQSNATFKKEVTSSLQNFFREVIDKNLQMVIIPIE